MLSVSRVNQYYGGSHILRDVGFDVPARGCTALLGRNGVGETTRLECVMGLVPIRSGAIALDGGCISDLPPYPPAALGIVYMREGRDASRGAAVLEHGR